MPTGERKDPYRVYNFRLEIDGIERGGFQECSGIDSSQDPIEYREGTDPNTARKVPGLVKFSNISLKWGMIDGDTDIVDWIKAAREKGDVGSLRKNLSIILADDTGEEKIRWNVSNAWPTKWTGASLNATGNTIAIETLELAHESLLRA